MGEPQAGAVVEVDPVAQELGERFREAGHQLYLVGGAVRDAILGRAPHTDLDLATSAPPQETIRLLRAAGVDQLYLMGVKYGTIGARKDGRLLEITTFREEVYREENRKPVVTFASDIRTDLSRRDFTINAMAIRLPDGAFEDPFGGLKDLAAKSIDTPLEPEIAFTEDPLRMLRAARFAAQLGFTVVPEVQAAMTAMAGRLSAVSAERIGAELTKLICSPGPDGPVRGISVLVDTGVAEQILPEVPRLRLEADEHVRHKDLYQHTLTVLARATTLEATYGLENDLVVRLAALLHDIGKPTTRRVLPDGRVTFHHHEVVGAAMARDRLSALRFPSAVVSDVSGLVALHLRFHGYGQAGWTDSAVRRYVRDAGPLLARLHVLTRADCTTRNEAKALRLKRAYDDLEGRIKALSAQEELDKIRPDLDGTEIMEVLGIPPGPLVGQAKRFLLELRIEHGPLGRDRAGRELLRWAEARGLEVPAPPATPPAEG